MSRFSGKCDFLDSLEIRDIVDDLEKFNSWKKKTVIYINREELEFETIKDLVPYYTHIITLSHFSDNKNIVHLSSKSWLELEEERYFPTPYRIKRMHEFDDYVRKMGKEPVWSIPLEKRDKWTPCPLGEPYFCEPKLNNGSGSRYEKRFCPYMYSKRRSRPCKLDRIIQREKGDNNELSD